MKFMVSVDGMSAPRREHDDLGQALAEAKRLSESPSTFGRSIRVLQEVAIVHNRSPHFLSNLQLLDPNQLIKAGDLWSLIHK